MNRLDKNELESVNVHSFPDVMSVALWVIEYLSTDTSNQFGSSEIANYMTDKLGISTSRQAVHMALTKAVSKKFCHKANKGFSIMKIGQDELLKQTQKENVVFIEPGKPFAAGMKLEEIFSSTKGIVKISDPYVDIKTLNVLYRCPTPGLVIKLLTVQIKDQVNFKHEILKLQQEGYNIEVRTISAGDLHDRYFIDDNHFWLSGNSLNNIGRKESFIVRLDGDIRKSMMQTFDSRWQSAITI